MAQNELTEQIKALTELVKSQQEQIQTILAQKTRAKKVLEIRNAPNPAVEAYVRKAYSKRKYKDLASIEIKSAQVTPTGLLRLEIEKTLNNGVKKSHPFMVYN